MAPVHVRKLQLRRGWSGSFRDIGCVETKLARLPMRMSRHDMVIVCCLFSSAFDWPSTCEWGYKQPFLYIQPSLSRNFSLNCCCSPKIISPELLSNAFHVYAKRSLSQSRVLSLNCIVRHSRKLLKTISFVNWNDSLTAIPGINWVPPPPLSWLGILQYWKQISIYNRYNLASLLWGTGEKYIR